MKERTSRTKMLNVIPSLKSTERTRSEPNLFPPINNHHGNRGALRTLSGPRDQQQQQQQQQPNVASKAPGHALPSRSVLYRNWGLVTNGVSRGSTGVRIPSEENPETTRSSNLGHSTPKRKSVKVAPKFETPKKHELSSRSPFNATPHSKDDNGAVRKKIEEFRQWHEEQYRQKLEALKARAEHETNGRIKAAEALALANTYRDKVTPLNELRVTDSAHNLTATDQEEPTRDKSGPLPPRTAAESLPRLASRGLQPSARHADVPVDHGSASGPEGTSSGADSPPAAVPPELRERPYTARTWRTWRDVNQSDAYKDVAAYIKENELLEDDKAKHIRDWVYGVEEARMSGECVGVDGRPIGCGGHVGSDNTSSSTAETR